MSEGHYPSAILDRPLTRIPFSPRHEAGIQALSNWMQVAAVISIVAAVAKVVNAFTPRQDFGRLIDAAITLLLGIWIYQAGAAFRKVATTDTADQTYLMEGFSLLRRVFLLQAILVIVTLTFVVIALVAAAVVMALRGPRV
jgi:L-asparagine transporter-like permease